MLSIIIPTLNEEGHLPLLLKSIKKQGFKDYEVIVADAGSIDRTVEIAKNYGCRVVSGGLPAKGRNKGAKAARGELLLFLDADTILPDEFLEKNLEDFEKRNLGVATFFQEPRTERKFYKFLFCFYYNWLALLFSKFSLFGGVGILVKKSVHEEIGGFDESAKMSEDVFYLKRACKITKFGIVRQVKLFVSARRYEKEGWLRIFLKHFLGGFLTTFFGPIRSNILKYKFSQHKK